MVRWFLLGLCVCALLVLSGCGDSGPKTYKISGTVELDGKPLEEGSITLVGEGGTAPDKIPIKKGKFEGSAQLGKKKVEIRAFKEGPKATMDKEEIEGTGTTQYLPPRFNTASTITAEVTASGINPSKFTVEEH